MEGKEQKLDHDEVGLEEAVVEIGCFREEIDHELEGAGFIHARDFQKKAHDEVHPLDVPDVVEVYSNRLAHVEQLQSAHGLFFRKEDFFPGSAEAVFLDLILDLLIILRNEELELLLTQGDQLGIVLNLFVEARENEPYFPPVVMLDSLSMDDPINLLA